MAWMDLMMEMNLWTEKYRPPTLNDIVGQDLIVKSLMNFVENKSIPHCLFSGPPGTSKTTAAIAMARDFFGEVFTSNFAELNASDERGIDVVRNQVKNFARTVPAGGFPFKILVLDEADHLTPDAQHALRRTMETYAASCRMVLICNYSSRIIPPIQSRCAIFRFSRLDNDVIRNRIRYIAEEENVSLNDDGLEAILYLANGDMRAAINLIQAASSTGDVVTDERVYGISGRANPVRVRKMLQYAYENEFVKASEMLWELLYESGVSPVDLVRQIHRELGGLSLPKERILSILERTSEAEFRLSEGADGEVQLSALLAALGLVKSK